MEFLKKMSKIYIYTCTLCIKGRVSSLPTVIFITSYPFAIIYRGPAVNAATLPLVALWTKLLRRRTLFRFWPISLVCISFMYEYIHITYLRMCLSLRKWKVTMMWKILSFKGYFIVSLYISK